MIQKEKIEELIENNHCLLSIISSLKQELKDTKIEFDNISKSVKKLNSGTNDLNQILKIGKTILNKEGIGYDYSR